jgi:DNA-binding NtrC family response regulator
MARIVVIDTDEGFCKRLGPTLAQRGHEVVQVGSTGALQAAADAARPHMVVVGRLAGALAPAATADVVARLKRDGRMPVIMVGESGDPEALAQAAALDADAVVPRAYGACWLGGWIDRYFVNNVRLLVRRVEGGRQPAQAAGAVP